MQRKAVSLKILRSYVQPAVDLRGPLFFCTHTVLYFCLATIVAVSCFVFCGRIGAATGEDSAEYLENPRSFRSFLSSQVVRSAIGSISFLFSSYHRY